MGRPACGGGANPGEAFSYTVGLTAVNHPEVVVTGLPFDAAQSFLNLVGAEVQKERRFMPGAVTSVFTSPNSPVIFIRADDTGGLTAVRQVYGQVEAVQMIWPDSAGRLPWMAGYNNAPEAQPLLGSRRLGSQCPGIVVAAPAEYAPHVGLS